MSPTVIPDALMAKLKALTEPVEVFTSDGLMIGYISPAKPKTYTPEELKEAAENPGPFSTPVVVFCSQSERPT